MTLRATKARLCFRSTSWCHRISKLLWATKRTRLFDWETTLLVVKAKLIILTTILLRLQDSSLLRTRLLLASRSLTLQSSNFWRNRLQSKCDLLLHRRWCLWLVLANNLVFFQTNIWLNWISSSVVWSLCYFFWLIFVIIANNYTVFVYKIRLQ